MLTRCKRLFVLSKQKFQVSPISSHKSAQPATPVSSSMTCCCKPHHASLRNLFKSATLSIWACNMGLHSAVGRSTHASKWRPRLHSQLDSGWDFSGHGSEVMKRSVSYIWCCIVCRKNRWEFLQGTVRTYTVSGEKETRVFSASL